MNRNQRRAEAAQRAECIRRSLHYLAFAAAPTVTGSTLILPDGDMLYISVEEARAFYGLDKPAKPEGFARGSRA